MTISFTVKGPPVGWQRAGVNRRTGRHYTQQKTKNAEEEIALAYRIAAKGRRFPTGTPLAVCVYAYFPIPKRVSKATRAAMISKEILPTVKPDWDNIGKLVDGLNGVAFDDDKDIVCGSVVKMYSDEPRMVFVLKEAWEVFLEEAIK